MSSSKSSNTEQYFKPRIIDLSVNDIYILHDNPNRMSALQTQSLEYSIDKFELLKPLVVDQDNQLIDGHQRLTVLKKKGITKVQCVQTFVKDETERHLIMQALNKIRGEHDKELDANMLMHLLEQDPISTLAVTMEEDERNIQQLIKKFNPDYETLSSLNDNEELVEEEEESKKTNKTVTCPNCGTSFDK